MKVIPVFPMFWSGFLVLCASQDVTEGSNQDLCLGDNIPEQILEQSSSSDESYLEKTEINETFNCLLYPTNMLNCSWSFHNSQENTLSVFISICDGESAVHSLNPSSEVMVGSTSLILQEYKAHLQVILHFNMSMHDQWKSYTYPYDIESLEVLSPPPNVSAAVKDGDLLVTWDLPHSRSESGPSCFEYELDLGDEEQPKQFSMELSFKKMNVDPAQTYTVRIRTRKKLDTCLGSAQWSEWSPVVTVGQPVYNFFITLLIVSILLGIPMIIMAVLQQRVSKFLFPPIPRPPPKYIYFLEKNDTFSFFHPALSPEEEITKVEEAE